ncbi:hypothetical protein GA0115249_117734 [Streptomyces sp. PpalLS-921]|nr:hypothetical protein GA0115249_117734 [Streptomyces sp. PpalLS-921]
MSPRPQKWKELSPDISAPHRQFVEALRRMRELSDRTQQQIATDAYLAATSLSNHLNGGRIPESDHLSAFYRVLDQDAAKYRRTVPYSLDLLLDLRVQALIKHCTCCSVGYPAESAGPPEPEEHKAVSPAPRAVRRRARELRLRRYRRSRALHAESTRTEVPVPLLEGDRHLTTHISEAWPEITDLARRLKAGNARDADLMLWSAATTLSASNIQVFVASCRSAGLDDAADQVITNAARRDAQAVLSIAAAFHHEQQHEEAGRLIALAAQST